MQLQIYVFYNCMGHKSLMQSGTKKHKVMTYSSEIPDYKKFEYLIANLNLFLISGHGGEAFLLNDSVDDTIAEIQRLACEYWLTIPTWVQRYIDTPKGTNEKI